MRTKATVIAVKGSIATVETERTSACEGCHKAEGDKGCSVCSLMGGDRKLTSRAKNAVGAQIGDLVWIESATGRMLWYAVLVFLAPIACAVLGWGIASLLTTASGWQILGGFFGFVLCFVFVFFYSRYIEKTRCDVEITEIISKENG